MLEGSILERVANRISNMNLRGMGFRIVIAFQPRVKSAVPSFNELAEKHQNPLSVLLPPTEDLCVTTEGGYNDLWMLVSRMSLYILVPPAVWNPTTGRQTSWNTIGHVLQICLATVCQFPRWQQLEAMGPLLNRRILHRAVADCGGGNHGPRLEPHHLCTMEEHYQPIAHQPLILPAFTIMTHLYTLMKRRTTINNHYQPF